MRDSPDPNAPRASGRISRREFIRLAATVGLMAGCRSTAEQVLVTATPTPSAVNARLSLLDGMGRVVRAQHSGAWADDTLSPAILREMVDAGITSLTGIESADQAWQALFSPEERIAIKVNACPDNGCEVFTHVALVDAVTQRLQETGIPAGQIVIYDRYSTDLETAGFTINQSDQGVQCYGTDRHYTEGWSIVEKTVELSDILLECDALINMPLVKVHPIGAITCAMKNHYGSFDRPQIFHENLNVAVAELNALPPIKDRTRLIIGDALAPVRGDWQSTWPGDSILLSYDPIAHDRFALQILAEAMASDDSIYGGSVGSGANAWLQNGTDLGLGTNDPEEMEWVMLSLG